ncbi:MAG: serine/threonine protein kinase [Sandaracinaceae bacterium]|nr:serine/threonine protein kinase [Sandaracinaceae bacterium]
MVTAYSRDSDPLLGATIAEKYRIEALIARGGMGRVYRATQLALEREVALKVLDLRWLAQSGSSDAVVEDFQRRFVLEAASAAKLTHPNTIVIHDYGVEGDALLYMVMELVEGRTLAERLDRDGPLSAETVVRIMAQVCGSLAEAHGRGMVHRDLKPSNIMLTQRGSQREFVKVLDFGLVKQGEDVSMTRSGALVGTPRYMSPEQVANAEVTPASDVYGLGACMYHALTGQPPFDSESAYVLMAAHVNTRPPPMAEVDPNLHVPPELEKVVLRCLSKSPTDRYGSMEEVSMAMQAALGEDFTLSGSRSLIPSGSTPLGRLPSKDWTDSLTDTRVRLHEASVSTVAPPRQRVALVLVLAGLALLALVLVLRKGQDALPEEPNPSAPSERVDDDVPGGVDPASEAGRVEVWIRSTPAGASVSRGTEDLGNTPARLLLGPNDRWSLTLAAPGHVSRTLRVSAAQPEVTVVLEPAPAPAEAAAVPSSEPERPHPDGPRNSTAPGMASATAGRRGEDEAAATTMTSGEPSPAAEHRTDNRDPWDTP